MSTYFKTNQLIINLNKGKKTERKVHWKFLIVSVPWSEEFNRRATAINCWVPAVLQHLQ